MEEIFYLDEIYSSSILSTSQVISFSSWNQNCTLDEEISKTTLLSPTKRVCSGRTMSQAQDHLIAERKRRENLAQLFVSLSKVLPGIKKLDKASLLEDAINHLKELQERVSFLEEEMIITSKRNLVDADCYSTSPSSDDDDSQVLIKARVLDTRVLIRIHCKKQSGLMSRVPCQMEKIRLSVVDMRIMPFGVEALDITIMAEMQSEFRGTVKEIVDHMRMLFVTAL